jgi:enterochelin esterase-like enzyme
MTGWKLFFCGICALAAIAAQTTPPAGTGPARGTGGRGGMASPATALRSPEVHPDRRVTFRHRAPQADKVELAGEIVGLNSPREMKKDENGIWTVTIGPLEPEIYVYNFRVQGVNVTDPSNPWLKPTPPGQTLANFVEVPGDTPAFYDARPVPHGEVRMRLYESKVMGVTRWLWVYTPPDYDRSTAKYPVLYLLHGNGENQSGWVVNGRTNIILDNLIAEKKALPMVVVMPQAHALQAAGVAPLALVPNETGMFSDKFPPDLLNEIIPLVEKTYRVQTGAEHRAIAGLSMGGGQALRIGLANPDVFHWVLGFSAAVGGQFGETEQLLQKVTADSAGMNRKLRLLWISVGRQDFLYQADKQFAEALKAKGVNVTYKETEGGHFWNIWRANIHETAQMLFAPRR